VTDWQEEYKKKIVPAETAASLVKSGDRVAFTLGREALAVGLALAARKDELKDVHILDPFPGYDFGWYDPGWEDSFEITIWMPTALSQQMMDERRCHLEVSDMLARSFFNGELGDALDVVITEVSSPDNKGFCSFGASLWNKRRHIKKAKLVIAEVNPNLIRTYGDNYVHVSEIDYFVEHAHSGATPGLGSLAGRALKELQPHLKDICGYVSEIIKDGDTVQIGVGRTTEPLVRLGLIDGKHDLGWHSEATPPGVIALVKEGVINGSRKTLHPGKVVVTSIGGSTTEEMNWVHENPLFWLVDVEYLYRTVALNDNMVTINNAVVIDLGGQISAESIGTRIISAAGGQPAFVYGALCAKGGRAVTVIPSVARSGDHLVSRIVPVLEPGTTVTIPRWGADIIVTEYGVAHLRGKSLRARAEELITVAHPDFRAELKKAARKLGP